MTMNIGIEPNNTGGNASGHWSHENMPTAREYLQVLFRGKWIILASLVVVLGATAFFTLSTKPIYEATATVLIDTKGSKEALPFFDAAEGIVKNIRNEIEVLKSRSLVEAVAEKLLQKQYLDDKRTRMINVIQVHADSEPSGRIDVKQAIAARILNTLQYEPVRDSDILRIIARSTDPDEAALIANTVSQVYYDRNLQASRTRSRAVREFLQEQLNSRQEVLSRAEDSLQAYMEKTGIVSLDQEASKVIDQLSKLEAERDAVNIELQVISKTLTSYKEQLTAQEPVLAQAIGEANDPYIKLLQEELAKLEVQKDLTIAQNPKVATQELYTQKLKEIDDQIASLRTKLKGRTEEFLRSTLPEQPVFGEARQATAYVSQMKQKIVELQIQRQSMQAKQKVLSEFIRSYDRQFDAIPRQSLQLARFQRARLSNEKLYLLVEEKFNEVSITEQSEFGYVDIVDPAIAPSVTISPNLGKNLLLASLAGLALGVILAFVRSYMDVIIRTPEDLKNSGFRMMSLIEHMASELSRIATTGKLEQDNRHIDQHVITLSDGFSRISESFRRLRTSIQYARVDKPIHSLVVTSPDPEEGKTTIAANLAVVFAQAGKKVLLVDTDLRKPALHTELSLRREPGLFDLLFEKVPLDDVVQKTGVENLEFISSGKTLMNSSELLGSNKMRGFFEEQKKKYDLILFDTPPILAVTDATILSSFVDGVLVVAAAGETRVDALQRTSEILTGVGAHLLGVVLNKFDFKQAYAGQYGHYYHKHSYYHYGYDHRGNGEADKERTKEQKKRSG